MAMIWEYFPAYQLTESIINTFLESVFGNNGPFYTQVSTALGFGQFQVSDVAFVASK